MCFSPEGNHNMSILRVCAKDVDWVLGVECLWAKIPYNQYYTLLVYISSPKHFRGINDAIRALFAWSLSYGQETRSGHDLVNEVKGQPNLNTQNNINMQV